MRRKGSSDDGFVLCFLFNLLFNFWWGILAFILWILYLLLGIPLYWTLIATLVWFGVALFSTWFVTWAVNNGNEPTPHRENLNPYSAKNSEVFKDVNIPDKTLDTPQEIEQESGLESDPDCLDKDEKGKTTRCG